MNRFLSGFLIPVILLSLNTPLWAASYRDFRTKASGNWNALSTWEMYNGGWGDATWTPTSADEDITIQAGYSVNISASVTVDQVNVKGALTLYSGVTLTINNGAGTDILVDNTPSTPAYFYVYGTIINQGTLSKIDGTIYYYDNSTYKHAQNGGSIEDASWSANSTCEITGITDDTGGPAGFNQTFGNVKWNCTGQTSAINLSQIPTMNGNFTMSSTWTGSLALSSTSDVYMTIGGNYFQDGGNFYPSKGSANDILYIGGNFNMTGGKLGGPPSGSGSTTLVFTKNGIQTYSFSAGQNALNNKLNFQVNSSSILDIGSDVLGDPLYTSGTFTLSSGGGLMTANTNGITSSGASGCIQVTGSRSYAQGAYYTFYANGSQSTGNGFPTTLTGTVTIGSTSNATNLTLTNGSLTVNNQLTLVSNSSTNSSISGTVAYGSNGTLEYQGGIGQTASAVSWPSTSAPANVIINNANGVALPVSFSRTINGTLYLTSGTLSIGPNLLTLNNAGISKTSGSLTGGSGSCLTFSGTGSTSLPGVTNGLSMLTLIRSGSTITMTGNVSVNDTLILTNGAFSLSGGAISYGSNGTLKYNGSSAQTTGSAEFPVSGGPQNLYIKNSEGVTLHSGRTLNGTLYLKSGVFSIGTANTLSLNKDINLVSGSLTGGASSNITFGEYTSATTLPAVANGLGNLTINRVSGITLGANLTIAGTLTLSSGPLSIGSTTLTLNGLLTKSINGSLTGGLSSNIIVGGTSMTAMDLPHVSLNNLTLNRASGIRQVGDITVNGTMTLTNGSLNNNGWAFIYGSGGTLKFNGTSSQTTTNSEFPVSSGPFNLYIDNAVSVGLHDDRTLGGTLTLNSGQFSIGAHTLTLDGGFTQNPGASLLGGNSSNIIFGDNVSSTNLPSVTLKDLTISRTTGIGLGGNVSVEGMLSLNTGSLSIYANTLTINGIIAYTSNLLGSSMSNMIFGGSGGAGSLHAIELNSLTLNRSAGLDLADSVTVYGQFTLMNGQIRRHGFRLYGGSTMLRYNYGSTQTTSDEELPDSKGPHNIMVDMVYNSDQMNLHSDKTIKGDLFLGRGAFSIGAHTLTLNGMIMPGMGLLKGGESSNLIFGGTGAGTMLPTVTLNDLTINRSMGILMNGDVTVSGSLILSAGTFGVSSYILTLQGGPIGGTTSNLQTNTNSGLYFEGNFTGITIPPGVIQLGKLKAANPNGVEMTNNLMIQASATVSNYLKCADKSLFGPGIFIMESNSKLAVGHSLGVTGNISMSMNLINSNSDFEFNGNADQVTNFLPTSIPNTIRNLTISNGPGANVRLVNNMTLTGILDLRPDAKFTIDPSYILITENDLVIHE